jgi:hypothetical protein
VLPPFVSQKMLSLSSYTIGSPIQRPPFCVFRRPFSFIQNQNGVASKMLSAASARMLCQVVV